MPKESYIKPDVLSEALEPEALCCGSYGSPGSQDGHCCWCGHSLHVGRACQHRDWSYRVCGCYHCWG